MLLKGPRKFNMITNKMFLEEFSCWRNSSRILMKFIKEIKSSKKQKKAIKTTQRTHIQQGSSVKFINKD